VALPAFAHRTPLLQQSINISCKRAAAGLLLWACAGADRQTPYRFIHPAPHAMPAVPVTGFSMRYDSRCCVLQSPSRRSDEEAAVGHQKAAGLAGVSGSAADRAAE